LSVGSTLISVDDHESVAIRRRAVECVRADLGHGAWPVVDYDGLPETRAELIGDQTAQHVESEPAGLVMIKRIGRAG
jgi:hypothetical protein